MNTDTGEIRRFHSVQAARAAGFTLALNEDEARALMDLDPDKRIGVIVRERMKARREKYPGQHTAYLKGAHKDRPDA